MWGDVLFCVKEDATAALGAGAGDGVEIEHAVWGWEKITQDYQWMRERELERERDGARVLHFALFYLYLRHTAAPGKRDQGKQRRGMREME